MNRLVEASLDSTDFSIPAKKMAAVHLRRCLLLSQTLPNKPISLRYRGEGQLLDNKLIYLYFIIFIPVYDLAPFTVTAFVPDRFCNR